MQTTLSQTIERLRELYSDPYADAFQPRIAGYLGELMVLNTLQASGCQVTHLGGGKHVDIECPDGTKIEVRTSTKRKPYRNTGVKWWGWDLRRGSDRPIPYDYVICVQLDEMLSASFLVIHSSKIHLFPDSPEFRNGVNALVLPEGEPIAGKEDKYHLAFDPFLEKDGRERYSYRIR